MTINTTRRALLGAATTALAYAGGAAIVGGAAVAASEAKGASAPADRRAWDVALAAFHHARAESEAHYESVEKPARDRVDSIAPHPGGSFTVFEGGRRATFRWQHDKPDFYDDLGPALRDAANKHRAKIDAWRIACCNAGFDSIRAESDMHGDREAETEERLFATPAPDLAAVALKLDILWNEQKEAIPSYNELVLADVRRLAGEAV